jgi:hypothetical protein
MNDVETFYDGPLPRGLRDAHLLGGAAVAARAELAARSKAFDRLALNAVLSLGRIRAACPSAAAARGSAAAALAAYRLAGLRCLAALRARDG